MALPNTNINAGTPPLLWSNVQEAFEKINENFTALDLATGGTAVDLSSLSTDIIPISTQTYQLGDQLHRWKSVHTGEWSLTPGQELNGLWAGAAQIKGIGLTIDLPPGSTVDGDLIINPDKTFFKAAQVDNELRIEADEFSDTLNLNSGTAMQLIIDSSGESITFNNIGVTSAAAGLGISVSSATGAVTVTNTGVRSLQSVTALPSGRSTGAGINISGSTGDNLRITNTGILAIQQGFGITVSTDIATGVADISFNPGVAPQTAFTTIAILGDAPANNIQSDSIADTLTFAQGYGIILTNNSTTDTMTVSLNQRIDIIGSVFGDDSTKIVDAVENKVYAEFFGNLNGNVTGNVTGNISGSSGLFTSDVQVGLTGNGRLYAIGNDVYVGNVNAGSKLGLVVREGISNKTVLEINATAKTIALDNTYTVTGFIGSVTGNIFTNLIDSADSSQIVVTPLMRFESDAVVENDLTVNNLLLVRGQRVILLNDFKALVAASTSFANFQARIAALV